MGDGPRRQHRARKVAVPGHSCSHERGRDVLEARRRVRRATDRGDSGASHIDEGRDLSEDLAGSAVLGGPTPFFME
jgi:hypothetical protein